MKLWLVFAILASLIDEDHFIYYLAAGGLLAVILG